MSYQKWENQKLTAKGEERASVPFSGLKTLWFNTGTQCNLECQNCYIESSPKNDRLIYLSKSDIQPFLQEIKENHAQLELIGLTGGEPFLNPHITELLDEMLTLGIPVLVLTNAHKVITRWEAKLLALHKKYGDLLRLRVSFDHYTEKQHELERGPGTFNSSLKTFRWLHNAGFNMSIAGRSICNEGRSDALRGYENLLNEMNIDLKLTSHNIVIFPEMIPSEDVPEISTGCWDVLKVSPTSQMCSTERMIVRRKGSLKATVLACTLLAYDERFELGETLKESFQKVYLGHPFCSKFCVLGGASCSSTT